ncbi:transcription antitermination factor NusB [Salipaludibacillus neizhouensis]|uniref:Transcription antitermination protein NusB n=1 Tax=Salipaludibacillus neizhouensis TaxID=885475 RepID=A0A3A9KGT4_9BACI|nr:transcription antitermination factor NusB [Salipaludibacillus neizhouensis]RKL68773.1 transcription antitermination factor NusB [Salipaludibacillus neizhouensis]
MNRRLARIRTIQALYQVEMTDIDPSMAIESVLEKGDKQDDFLDSLVNGTLKYTDEIDSFLHGALEHWSLERISRIERAILRMAVYEMKYVDDIPINVSLNEAIDLAKGFIGEEESGKFVNGVLSNVANVLKNS